MKGKYILYSIILSILTFLFPYANVQAAETILEDTLIDNLDSMEDIKWYSFEMNEPGDVHMIVRGLQESWDGWSSHWYVVIYASDAQTILAEGKASGYNDEYKPPASFSLLGLESGTYYIRISSSANYQEQFITDSYQLEIDKTYSSSQPFVDSDTGIYVIGTEPFLDRLISEGQVHWYMFEMDEYGDALLSVTGLQEEWDGYTYSWRCTIYGEDRKTVVTSADVRGYSKNDGPSILSAANLGAGIYYVQMASASSVNPLMASFSSEPYKVHLFRYYHSTSVEYDDNGFQTFQSAGDVLWMYNGTAFLKLNDGECLGTLIKSSQGTSVPFLISTEAAAVEYVVSGTGEKVMSKGPWYHKDSGKNYYYSACGNSSTIEKIMEKRQEAEYGKIKYWFMKLKGEGATVIGGVVILILAIVFIYCISGSSGSSEASYSGSSASYSSGNSIYDSSLHDDLDALMRANKISETYGSDWRGYDAEAPGPDPEAPGPDPDAYSDSRDVW